jgi:hypothetical protein
MTTSTATRGFPAEGYKKGAEFAPNAATRGFHRKPSFIVVQVGRMQKKPLGHECTRNEHK